METPDNAAPEWEREVTLDEAIELLLGEAYDAEDWQRRFAAWNDVRLTAPSPTAMRRAFVLRHAATILQIVHQNSDEFKRLIVQKRAKQAQGRR